MLTLQFCPSCCRYEVALHKESAEAGSFHSVVIGPFFTLVPRAAVVRAGGSVVAPDIADSVPMLFVSESEWQLAFFQENGRVPLQLQLQLLA